MNLHQVAEYCDGVLHGNNVEWQQVSTDSRSITDGALFVALRGATFDGHDYLADAATKGAVAAVAEQPVNSLPTVVVANSRRALGLLAAAWADQFSLTRIAVTGNAGKTTVKEMIALMLSDPPAAAQVHATRGNLNNDIGVPLTLLGLRPAHRFAVMELGANAPGEITWTSSLVKADVCLITNVTGAHLAGFGSMQGIAKAKAEIFQHHAADALAIINADDSFADFFADQAARADCRLLRVGEAATADWRIENVRVLERSSSFTLAIGEQRFPVVVPLPGAHQVSNAALALAAAIQAGADIQAAIRRLLALQSVAGRMTVHDCLGGTLVDDTYNASPGAVRAAIDWLAAQPRPQVLVLGDLAELGQWSDKIHLSLGDYARQAELDAVLAVGAQSALTATTFGSAGEPLADCQAAAQRAATCLQRGGTVLVKGSRNAAMNRVVEQLRDIGGEH